MISWQSKGYINYSIIVSFSKKNLTLKGTNVTNKLTTIAYALLHWKLFSIENNDILKLSPSFSPAHHLHFGAPYLNIPENQLQTTIIKIPLLIKTYLKQGIHKLCMYTRTSKTTKWHHQKDFNLWVMTYFWKVSESLHYTFYGVVEIVSSFTTN